MKHEHRILEKQLISGKISPQEFKERIDALKEDTYDSLGLAEMLFKGEVTESEFVERYNRLIDQESEKHREPFQPHEHI